MSRVTEIRYIGYGVQDFELESGFYTGKWGLQPVTAEGDLAWFRTQGGDEPATLRLRRSDANHLDVIALATDSRRDVEALYAAVTAAQCRIVHAPRPLSGPGGGHGFRCFTPDGLPLEISSDVARAPGREV